MRISAVFGIACALGGLTAGCSETTDGTAERSKESTSSSTTVVTSSSATPTTAAGGLETVGVVETTRKPVEPKSKTCDPLPPGPPSGAQLVSFIQGNQPEAPVVQIVAPETWKFTVEQGSPVMSGAGPDGMTGSVAVAPTDLAPAAAFEKYADDIAKKAPISAVNVWPAELCGYSGQRQFGTLSGGPEAPVEFSDRIVHVWTNTADYLVAVHLQAPKGAPGFEDVKDMMMQDFEVVIP